MKKEYFEPVLCLFEVDKQNIITLSGDPSDLGGDTEYGDSFGGEW